MPPTAAGFMIDHAAWGPFYKHGLTLLPASVSDDINYKTKDEITYPFTSFNGVTV